MCADNKQLGRKHCFSAAAAAMVLNYSKQAENALN
jgi:hypothetical protein